MSRCFLESEGRLNSSCRYELCYRQLPVARLTSAKSNMGLVCFPWLSFRDDGNTMEKLEPKPTEEEVVLEKAFL